MTGRAVRLRIATTAGILAMVFAALFGRAVQLTVFDGAELRRLADREHRQRVPMPAKRGPIVDRMGEPLALTRESAAVYLRPRELNAGPEALTAVARLLGLPPRVVQAKAASSAPFVWLSRQVSLDRWATVADLGLSGIGSESARVRVYPQGSLAGHVLGFAGIDGQGLEGIERVLDHDLRGEVEALDVERDARGRRMVMMDGRWRPLPRVGATVELTIDSALQHVAEAELERAVAQFQAEAASAVVLDAFTGEVLAMANVPAFDPNNYASASAEQWRNRVITDFYEPGSTFKAITAAAALDADAVKPEDLVYCENGRYAVGRRVVHDAHPKGTLSFADVIAHSSNIGTAKVAERLGRERFAATIEKFGFGAPTGIDLRGEVGGLVRPADHWGRIHLVTTAFGQGISVTPLQLARAFGAIANGGLVMRPYVVRRVVDEEGRVLRVGTPTVQARAMSPETAAVLTTILRGVVERGTGKQAQMDGFAVAGKTGTAQKVEHGRYSARKRMSSFVGFVPADRPELVILVLLDSPRKATYGGTVAAPAFRQIAEFGLSRRGVRPYAAPVPDPVPVPAPARHRVQAAAYHPPPEPLPGGVPSFLGLSMRDALVQARQAGLSARIDGSGYVTAQDPAVGAAPVGTTLSLHFGSDAH